MKDIVITSLSKSFEGKCVLDGLSITLRAGRSYALMGASGIGKTTLLRILAGLERPDSGEVTGLPSRIAVVFQEDRLLPELSARKNLRVALPKSVSDDAIAECLAELGLAGEIDRPVTELSGGMCRRVAIARALLYPADLYLLDEPFRGLDEETRARVINSVRARTAGKTLFLVTHDREEIPALGAEEITGIF